TYRAEVPFRVITYGAPVILPRLFYPVGIEALITSVVTVGDDTPMHYANDLRMKAPLRDGPNLFPCSTYQPVGKSVFLPASRTPHHDIGSMIFNLTNAD